MIRSRLSNRDWEDCSAYLDGELTEKQLRRFKLELERNPDLRQAVEELRRTKTVLRSAARIHVPHHFTLTAKMVEKRAPAAMGIRADSLYPILRFSSVAASFLFVCVVATHLVTGSTSKRSMLEPAAPVVLTAVIEAAAPPPMEKTFAEESISEAAQPAAEPMAKEMEQPPTSDLNPQEYANDMGGGLGGEGAGEPPAMLAQPAAESSGAVVQATLESQPEPTPTTAMLTEVQREAYPAGQLPTQVGMEKIESVEERKAGEQGRPVNWWLILEVGMAVIALTSGAAAMIVKRRKG